MESSAAERSELEQKQPRGLMYYIKVLQIASGRLLVCQFKLANKSF